MYRHCSYVTVISVDAGSPASTVLISGSQHSEYLVEVLTTSVIGHRWGVRYVIVIVFSDKFFRTCYEAIRTRPTRPIGGSNDAILSHSSEATLGSNHLHAYVACFANTQNPSMYSHRLNVTVITVYVVRSPALGAINFRSGHRHSEYLVEVFRRVTSVFHHIWKEMIEPNIKVKATTWSRRWL
jgi:hypothetical protein